MEKPNYSGVVFPAPHAARFEPLKERISRTLDRVDDALAKEARDLKREAKGQDPVEGVGRTVDPEPDAIP